MSKFLKAEHQAIYQQPDSNLFGYFGWPTLARLPNGELVAGCSGFRNNHVCPWGQITLFTSDDEGRNWSAPQIIHNSMIDDRDAGVLPLADGRLLVSWFTSDTRFYLQQGFNSCPNVIDLRAATSAWPENIVRQQLGSFTRIRELDGNWGPPMPVKGSSPHGPIQLKNGSLFFLAAIFSDTRDGEPLNFDMSVFVGTRIKALVSDDFGKSWKEAGTFPLPEQVNRFCEPYAIELDDGRILAQVRGEGNGPFSIWQSYSSDGGASWSKPVFITEGSPPHLMRHSSGLLIGSYGYRRPGFGQRVMFSSDQGETWDTDWIIRDDGNNSDLGYPSTVELGDGGLYSVYYQAPPGQLNCAIQGSRWVWP